MNTKNKRFAWCLEQAKRIVAAYRAEAPEGVEVVCQAHGQTDTAHDRAYQLAILQGAHPRNVHDAALRQLEEIDRQEAANRQQSQFDVGKAQAERDFQQRQSLSEREFGTRSAEAAQRNREIEESRQGRLAVSGEAAKDRQLNALIHLAQNSMDPNIQKMANEAIARSMGVNPGATVDPRNAAVAQHHGVQTPGQTTPTGGGGPTTGPGGAPIVDQSRFQPGRTSDGIPSTPATTPPAVGQQPTAGGEGVVPAVAPPGGPGTDLARAVGPNAGPVHYRPDIGASVQTTAGGRDVVVGAPDPSVGALEGSIIAPGRPGEVVMHTPSGGTITSSMRERGQPVSFDRYAATHPNMLTPSQLVTGGAGGAATPTTPPGYTGGPAAAPGSTPWTTPNPLVKGGRPAPDEGVGQTFYEGKPQAIGPTPSGPPLGGAPPPTQFGSGAMSSGTHSGEWLAQQFANLGHAVAAHVQMPQGHPYDTGVYQQPGGGQPQPPGLPTAQQLARQRAQEQPQQQNP